MKVKNTKQCCCRAFAFKNYHIRDLSPINFPLLIKFYMLFIRLLIKCAFLLLGGAKVWECTETVGEYLTTPDGNNCLIDDFRDSTVLDLGCGAGILGILALQNGASVHFQDYVRLHLHELSVNSLDFQFSNIFFIFNFIKFLSIRRIKPC